MKLTFFYPSDFDYFTLEYLIIVVMCLANVLVCLAITWIIIIILLSSIDSILNHKGEHGSDIMHKQPEKSKEPIHPVNAVWLPFALGQAFVYDKFDHSGSKISFLFSHLTPVIYLGRTGFIVPANDVLSSRCLAYVYVAPYKVSAIRSAFGPILTNDRLMYIDIPRRSGLMFNDPAPFKLHVTELTP